MSRICRICLGHVEEQSDCHRRCLRGLFATAQLPVIDVELAKLHTAGLAMVGHTALSGIQKKISVRLTSDRKTLQLALEGGQYILKPQTETYPELPENEHVTTRLAQLVDLDTPAFGLLPLKDDSLAFVSARFDRRSDGRKVRQEDFCQLAGKSPKEKYDASSELCVRLLKRYTSEPLVEILRFYRQLVFAWWTGNGDMHLKNFSLQEDKEGRQRLTPLYDQVCTRLVIRDDPLALSVQGKNKRLSRATWMKFAEYCGIPERAAARVLARQVDVLRTAIGLVDRSFLSPEMKEQYQLLLRARTHSLASP